MNVTVVIPSYNRTARLDRALPTYLAQDGVREILLVDDASAEDYAALLARHADAARARGIELRHLRNDANRGAAASRQRGFDAARGDLVLAGEDDVLLAPDYARRLAARLEDGVALVGGRVVNLREGEEPATALARADRHALDDPIDYRWLVGNFESRVPAARDVPFVQAIGLWRRDALAKVRHFEGYAGNGYREETDPQIQLLAQGLRVVYEPGAVAYHLAHTDRGGNRKVRRAAYLRWTLRNNAIFLDRHLATLRARGFAPHPRWFMQGFLAWKIGVQLLRGR